MSLATLADVVAERKGATTTAAEEAYILRHLRYVSNRIGGIAAQRGFDFEPRYKTEKMTPRGNIINSAEGILTLPHPLLEIDTLTTDGQTLTEGTNVFAEPLATYPIRQLRLGWDTGYTWLPCNNSNPYNSIVLTGWWGVRTFYDEVGFPQIDSLAAALLAGDSSMTVADADGVDYDGIAPRFSAGGLYRIEDELVEATATNTTTNVVTILRGRRGTTASAHANGTAVKAWNVEPEIRRVCARQTAYVLARKGAFQTSEINDIGVINYPPDFVAEVYGVLQGFMYV
jgi:hypothetical protein